jgi:hypothetical protein
MIKKIFITFLFLPVSFLLTAQDVKDLVLKIKAKYDQVKDYEADAVMLTNVSFMKVPKAKVKIYYKKPDKLKIKNESGISFTPKGAMNINMSTVFGMGDFTALDAGAETLNGQTVKLVKLLPTDENASLVLATLYIDEKKMLVLKSKTTTKENGTYELTLKYGTYANYGLPEKVEFTFNTKDFKLPKGVTIDYDNGSEPKTEADKTKNKKGKVEITYSSYKVNKGVSDDVFK